MSLGNSSLKNICDSTQAFQRMNLDYKFSTNNTTNTSSTRKRVIDDCDDSDDDEVFKRTKTLTGNKKVRRRYDDGGDESCEIRMNATSALRGQTQKMKTRLRKRRNAHLR
ncbi:6056_t:CDS:2 [Ambispora gerdemannii]|uniref:6056_t:CDS:1 n=1 Tax=Ambispora gerdemannii TaxID=144530 RepID=A0A9N9ACH2_9GLOM|nr:6056_t:CDS:2 [Ambispora gerdemannii]